MFDEYEKLQEDIDHDIAFGFGCKNHRDVVQLQPFFHLNGNKFACEVNVQ